VVGDMARRGCEAVDFAIAELIWAWVGRRHGTSSGLWTMVRSAAGVWTHPGVRVFAFTLALAGVVGAGRRSR